ncbi:MAG: SseB family protein [Oscillospiraceae bacterium]|nr:SseB family protein [Oscillospiraceae bacterium]
MNTITDERKQIIKSALFEKGATKKMLADIDNIQEIIFLITELKECTSKNVGFNINDSCEFLYKHLISKFSELTEYFMISDNSTGGLFLYNNYAYIFSDENIANEAVKNFSDAGVECSLFRTSSLNMNTFEYLYYLGIKYLMIDFTAYSIAVNRSEIRSNAQIKKDNKDNNDFELKANPSLRFAISNFYSSLKNKNALSIDDKRLKNLENIMIYETANAKFLVPVKEKITDKTLPDDNIKIEIAKANLESQGELITVFTDKMDFDKTYPKGWNYSMLDFNSITEIALKSDCNGIVVNVSSERLSIDKNTILHIRETAKHMKIK